MLRVTKFNHVQICIPIEKEKEARDFYLQQLLFEEISKPQALRANGGFWFKAGDVEVHIGVEKMERVTSKRHIALEVENIDQARQYLQERGVPVQDEIEIPGVQRFSFFDPFGNRIELLAKETSALKQSVQKQFGTHAEKYVNSENHAKGADLQFLEQSIAFEQVDAALDIATGAGHVVKVVAPNVKEVVALDLTKQMLEVAEQMHKDLGLTNVRYVLGDAEQLPFEDQSFDLVTCRIAPHHFADIPAFLRESERVLRPGGQMILIDNVAPEDEDEDRFYNRIEQLRDPSHVRALKKSEWLTAMEKAGLVVEQMIRFDKTIKYENWLERMGVSAPVRQQIEQEFLNASADIKKALQLSETGSITGITGQSVLIKASKRS